MGSHETSHAHRSHSKIAQKNSIKLSPYTPSTVLTLKNRQFSINSKDTQKFSSQNIICYFFFSSKYNRKGKTSTWQNSWLKISIINIDFPQSRRWFVTKKKHFSFFSLLYFVRGEKICFSVSVCERNIIGKIVFSVHLRWVAFPEQSHWWKSEKKFSNIILSINWDADIFFSLTGKIAARTFNFDFS